MNSLGVRGLYISLIVFFLNGVQYFLSLFVCQLEGNLAEESASLEHDTNAALGEQFAQLPLNNPLVGVSAAEDFSCHEGRSTKRMASCACKISRERRDVVIYESLYNSILQIYHNLVREEDNRKVVCAWWGMRCDGKF